MKFSDIEGHESVKDQLRALADSDRIPHALLLSGPAGIGKLALARAFSQYIHCNHHRNGDSCGECPSCRQHMTCNNADMYYVFPVLKRDGKSVSDEYMDVWREFAEQEPYAPFDAWLDKLDAGNSQPGIYVQEGNEIVHKLSLSNYSAKYKILLIWLPERLQEATANKLLKLIEEPWNDTKIIFVSNEPQKILPTIFSRTQRINMRRLSEDEIAEVLQHRMGLEADDASEIAHRCEGNLATAMKLTRSQGECDVFRDTFQQVMRMAYRRDVRAMKDTADSLAAMGREKLKRMMEYFSAQVRENFIYNMQVPQLNILSGEEQQFSRNFSPFITTANVETLQSLIDHAVSDIVRNANAKMVLFDTFVSMIICIKRR